jgi:hypothetical protein
MPRLEIPSVEEQVAHTQQLHKLLGEISSMMHGHKITEDFVLNHGLPYLVNEKTYAGRRATAKECFKNATQKVLANPDLHYVEGHILVHGVPIHHAWTANETGQVYDPTLKPSKYVGGYIGVPFNHKYLYHTMNTNRVYGILGHESRKTSIPLVGGQVDNFKHIEKSTSPEVLAHRLKFNNKPEIAWEDDYVKHIGRPKKVKPTWITSIYPLAKQALHPHNLQSMDSHKQELIEDQGYNAINLPIAYYKDGSGFVNEPLRNRHKPGFDARQLAQITNHKLIKPQTVFRGDKMSNLNIGKRFADLGFTGTSLNPLVSRGFSNPGKLFAIHLPSGAKAYHIDRHLKGDNYTIGENELLLHPKTHFQVVGHSIHPTSDSSLVPVERTTHLAVVGSGYKNGKPDFSLLNHPEGRKWLNYIKKHHIDLATGKAPQYE